RRPSRSRYWSLLACLSCSFSCCSCSTVDSRFCTLRRSSCSWLSRSVLPWLLLACCSSTATRSARLARCACTGAATTRVAATARVAITRESICLLRGVDDFDATVLRPASLVGLGADRTLFAVGDHGQLAGRTAVGLQGRRNG